MLQNKGVPGVSLKNNNDHYFWYHHSEADVLTVLDSDELDRCLAVWAASSYVLANLQDPLPRESADRKELIDSYTGSSFVGSE
ncbi:unnamed protein product [Allacma fusca]|uniref:Plasma glutamate carboxypeptidase n=1 Tax=Allacma fusca TaxID=39272 RepID=A0A8J2NN92_9HEXA|nr:unnamed protein product [Allacma fusca]